MALTTQDKLGIANIGFQGLSGLLGGLDTSDEKARQEAEQNQLFQLLLANLQNQGGLEQDLTNEQLQRSLAFTSANPLGAENDYRKRNTLGLAGLDVLGGRQLARGTPNIAAGFSSRPDIQAAFSPANVDEAIRQRRIATAGIDPRAQQEIGGPGSDYASRLFGELQSSQNTRRDINAQGNDLIQQRLNAITQAQQEKEKGGGFWKKLGGALLPVAGIAANFIPGVGPIAGALISAGTGAAGGALTGGKKGALLGGALGGASAYGMSRAGIGEPSGRIFNNSMTSQSLPVGNFASQRTNPLLQSLSNATLERGLTGIPQNINQNRPNIQSALSRPYISDVAGFPVPQNNRVGLPMGQPDFLNRPIQSRPNIPQNISQSLSQQITAPDVRPNIAGLFPGNQGANANRNVQNLNTQSQMPLVQSGLGYRPDVQRFMETVGNADPQNQLGRASVAGLIASIIGGGIGGPRQLALPPGPTRLGLPGITPRQLPGRGNQLALPPGRYEMGQGTPRNFMDQILLEAGKKAPKRAPRKAKN